MTDETWAVVLRVGSYVVGAGMLALLSWWVKNQTSKTWLQKALSQVAVVLQGLASDVTSGMSTAIEAAAADGKITKEERASLVAQLVVLVKNSVSSRFLAQLEDALGLKSGSSFDTWLRGMAGEHIDAQIASALPLQTVGSSVKTASAAAVPARP